MIDKIMQNSEFVLEEATNYSGGMASPLVRHGVVLKVRRSWCNSLGMRRNAAGKERDESIHTLRRSATGSSMFVCTNVLTCCNSLKGNGVMSENVFSFESIDLTMP